MTYTNTQASGSTLTDAQELCVVYDEECPFCSRYMLLYSLREHGVRVNMINARSDHPLVEAVKARNLNLNDGMVVYWKGQFHYGPEAMHLLAVLGSDRSLFNRLNRAVFTHAALSRVVYPWLVRGRKMTLRLLGRKEISPT